MPDVSRPDLVRRAICSGVFGFIEWKPACLERFRDDPEIISITEAGVKLLLRQHVCLDGHQPEEHRETDPDWLQECPDDPWWYCVLIPVPEFEEGLYVKMRLLWDDGDPEDDAFVQLVSVHQGLR